MPDKSQLATHIRYHIELLSERNAQHDWEHLCRHFARESICSNILPATGSVQAGGDQGRDFETFHTYLNHSHLNGRSFVGLVSDKTLAFACSLDKKPFQKIQNDVKTILASGSPVERIYFFSTRGLDISKRHELQVWSRATYSVELEIFDGEAMAELLAQQDLFWLAQRYLQLPAEILPPVPAAEADRDWYTRTLEKWRLEPSPARSHADFSEIRSAAYVARGPRAYDEEGHPIDQYAKPELPFWIERLTEIADEPNNFDSLRRHAVFELSVLRLRGTGTLIGQEERIRAFFADIARLEDLSLISLTKSAKKAQRLNERCSLLEILGHVALMHHFPHEDLDIEGAFVVWEELAKLIRNAPLFPLKQFARYLNQFADVLGTDPNYDDLTQSVDALLGERLGQVNAAENCLERANSFLKNHDLPRAIDQLHRAKLEWFTRETLPEYIAAQIFVSAAYSDQQLFFAAKYYALASAHEALLADDLRVKPLIAMCLEKAATCDYDTGAWFGFLSILDSLAAIYPHYSNSIDRDFNAEGGFLQTLVFNLLTVASLTKALSPEIAAATIMRCAEILKPLGLGNGFMDLLPESDRRISGMDNPELWESIEFQFFGAPWGDLGRRRIAQWKASGITWITEWNNDYQTTVAAEGFLAGLQIILSDLAANDLCLMRTSVRIFVEALSLGSSGGSANRGYEEFSVSFDSGNADRIANVKIPSYQRFMDGSISQEDLLVGTLSVVSTLLAEVSLLPRVKYDKIIESRLKQGLTKKLTLRHPYGRCFHTFISEKDFQKREPSPLALSKPFMIQQDEILRWIDTPLPGYTREAADQDIRVRYIKFEKQISKSLRKLSCEQAFIKLVARFRAEGWKDWHILSMTAHVIMGYRLNIAMQNAKSYDEVQAARAEMMAEALPEPDDAPEVPLSEFTQEKFWFFMQTYMLSFVHTIGLQNHQRAPDFPGIKDFVTTRCRFWTDDVEHEDLFVCVERLRADN